MPFSPGQQSAESFVVRKQQATSWALDGLASSSELAQWGDQLHSKLRRWQRAFTMAMVALTIALSVLGYQTAVYHSGSALSAPFKESFDMLSGNSQQALQQLVTQGSKLIPEGSSIRDSYDKLSVSSQHALYHLVSSGISLPSLLPHKKEPKDLLSASDADSKADKASIAQLTTDLKLAQQENELLTDLLQRSQKQISISQDRTHELLESLAKVEDDRSLLASEIAYLQSVVEKVPEAKECAQQMPACDEAPPCPVCDDVPCTAESLYGPFGSQGWLLGALAAAFLLFMGFLYSPGSALRPLKAVYRSCFPPKAKLHQATPVKESPVNGLSGPSTPRTLESESTESEADMREQIEALRAVAIHRDELEKDLKVAKADLSITEGKLAETTASLESIKADLTEMTRHASQLESQASHSQAMDELQQQHANDIQATETQLAQKVINGFHADLESSVSAVQVQSLQNDLADANAHIQSLLSQAHPQQEPGRLQVQTDPRAMMHSNSIPGTPRRSPGSPTGSSRSSSSRGSKGSRPTDFLTQLTDAQKRVTTLEAELAAAKVTGSSAIPAPCLRCLSMDPVFHGMLAQIKRQPSTFSQAWKGTGEYNEVRSKAFASFVTDSGGTPRKAAASASASLPSHAVEVAPEMSMDSQNPQSRAEAEAALRSWESDAAPGFLQALLDISRESEAVGENVRLLATVLAKNAVGSSWRKTLGTREWSRIPETEKSCVRSAAASLLLNEPQRRVATQTGLLIANIARFDFPAKWPTLLSDLTSAAWWVEDGATQAKIEQNDRALFTLKHVVRAVKSKRIVVETSGPSGGSVSTAELKPLADKIAHERKMLNTKAEEIFPILRQQWQQHFIAFMDTRHMGKTRGPLANRCLGVLRELLHMLADSWTQLGSEIREFLEGIYRATTAISTMAISSEDKLRIQTANKARVRMLQCVIMALDRNPVEFAAFLPPFLALYSTNALTAPDAAGVYALPAKRRVLLTTFLARALVCPHYEPDMIKFIKMKDGMTDSQQLEEASTALTQWLSPEHCGHLIGAVISKYIALTPEELQEWQADPEGFIRSLDADTGPDADNPRACGVALLLCMLRKGSSHVAEAMLSYVTHLQNQAVSPSTLLLREACYRAVGEGFAHVSQHIDFTTWYASELQGLLEKGLMETQPEQQLLCARALWLIGVCGTDLPNQYWESGGLLREMPWQQERFLQESEQDLQASQQQQYGLMQDCQAHMAVVKAQAGAVFHSCFQLLSRVSEVDSMVRVLHLVTVMLEALGPKAQPHFAAITAALPQIWNAATQEGSSGPASRLHSALMAVLTHMVGRLGSLAIQDSHIQAVLYALLQKGLEGSPAEQEVLVEDAVKLLNATLSASSSLEPPLQRFLPNLITILQRSKDNAAIFQVLEGYFVAADPGLVTLMLNAQLPQIADSMHRSLDAILAAALRAQNSHEQPPPSGQQPPHHPRGTLWNRGHKAAGKKEVGALDMDKLSDASAAASLLTVLLEQNLSDGQQALLSPILRTAMHIVAATQPQGAMHLHSVADNLLEALAVTACSAPAMFPALMGNNEETEGRLLDRWVAIASTRHLEEILGLGTMGALQGRVKRHIAAAGLSTLLLSAAFAPMFMVQRLARILAVCLRALAESKAFAAEEAERRTLIANRDVNDASQDLTKLRRTSLSVQSAPRSLDLHAVVGAAAQKAVSVVGQEALVEAIGWLDSSFVQALRSVLHDAALVSEGDISEALKALSTKDDGLG
ncbi:hypothetical protein WJX79_006026 [Trebouxia sp. C0005]